MQSENMEIFHMKKKSQHMKKSFILPTHERIQKQNLLLKTAG